MSLRIIGGTYKGRRLQTVKGQKTRPTPERVREALFNILGDQVRGSRFADLFAGTGAVGIEALSRGAEHVSFVENAPDAIAVLRKNLASLEIKQGYGVIRRDVFALNNLQGEDIIFCAPPYPRIQEMSRLARVLAEATGGQACWVLQHPKSFFVKDLSEHWELRDTRKYGLNCLSFFSKGE